jgi:integrase
LTGSWRPFARRTSEPRPPDRTRGHLKRHVFPRLGRLWLHEIDEADIVSLMRELREAGLSPYTIRGIVQPVGRILGSAVRRKLIPSNPVRNLEPGERPKLEKPEIRILDSEGIAALLGAAADEWKPLLALSVFGGLRQSEALGLVWGDVDLEAEVIHVRRQLSRKERKRVAAKTPQAARAVVVFPALAKLLRAHRERQLASGFASPESFVFTTRTGGPIGHRNLARQALNPALGRAKLPAMRWHDLRHTCASLLISQGQSDVFIARMLGHASSSITRDVYGHLFDAAEHAARMRSDLEAAFGTKLVNASERTARLAPPDLLPEQQSSVASLSRARTGGRSFRPVAVDEAKG